jgi:hypothetical protein
MIKPTIMPILDKRIDEYISKSAEFARPILQHLRQLVHQANPDVKETIKWDKLRNWKYVRK